VEVHGWSSGHEIAVLDKEEVSSGVSGGSLEPDLTVAARASLFEAVLSGEHNVLLS
jgi:hypothetical protein